MGDSATCSNVEMKRKPSLAALRRKLDNVFSRYIRRRDGGSNAIGTCITCNKRALLQAGHFIPRQHRVTRWHPDNVHGQCAYCNCWGHGEQAAYYLALVKKIGQAKVDELMRLKRTTVKHTRQDLEELIRKYTP